MSQTAKTFLPINKKEMEALGWESPDFILVSGDPYIDHPSFGTAIIGRLLEKNGYKIAVLPQPDWKKTQDFTKFGRPRLGFLVTSGSIDSMVANYSANKKRRRKDSLSPNGEPGCRPDRAVIVYTNRCREAYKDCPVIIGGLEASLRRFAHYDYWDNKVRRSLLLDSKADILVYGMAEKSIVEVADALNQGFEARDISWVKGTVVRIKGELPEDTIELPSYEDLLSNSKSTSDNLATQNAIEKSSPQNSREDIAIQNTEEGITPQYSKEDSTTHNTEEDITIDDDVNSHSKAYSKSFKIKYENNEHVNSSPLAERYDGDNYVLQNPPNPPLSMKELDEIYCLPFTFEPHPTYQRKEFEIPAWQEMRFSITHVRGCYGNCAFCAITYHQGRIPTARSIESVVDEARMLSKKAGFKGYIHDVGGPTANIRGPACKKQLSAGTCKNKSCLYPKVCDNLIVNHGEYLNLLKRVSEIPGINKVFIRSGLRYDMILSDKKNGQRFIENVVDNHVSGILKVAPEHVSKVVLDCMMKPQIDSYDEFCTRFLKADEKARNRANREGALAGRKPRNQQYILPYFIASHPGSTLENTLELTEYIEKNGGFVPDQIQDFYPTPGTLSTCIYYTGENPFTGEKVYVPGKNPAIQNERRLQRALLHHRKSENKKDVEKALNIIGITKKKGKSL